jgi:hypothetical protein
MVLYLDRASGTYEYRVHSSHDSTSAMALPRSFSSPKRAPSHELSLLAGQHSGDTVTAGATHRAGI